MSEKEKEEKKDKEKEKEDKPQYENVTTIFMPLLKKFYENQPVALNVEPERIIIIKCYKKKNYTSFRSIANTRLVGGVWSFIIPDIKFIITVFDEIYKTLSEEQKEYVILHEYYHCGYDEEKEKYGLRGHDIENFTSMIKNPEWDLSIVNKKNILA